VVLPPETENERLWRLEAVILEVRARLRLPRVSSAKPCGSPAAGTHGALPGARRSLTLPGVVDRSSRVQEFLEPPRAASNRQSRQLDG
jgi:hypothetical protein